MEGFGSSDFVTPLAYGSVQDGLTTNQGIEHVLKRTYWKTKQTVIKKLKKPEDSFVVAGDSDIDAKLERAEQLQSSCNDLLHALARTSYHTRAISSYELSLGEFLTAYSESELTYAGTIMRKTGEMHQQHAKMRMKCVPPIIRLHQEFCTFTNNAITDLNESIRRLEKARMEYRAALLWMKNVSEKLHDPDQRNQLVRFREAQATVKQTKEYFDKMKKNLMEKIEMVSASRCNLLSHTLPSYQTEVIQYLDQAATELHKLTVTLRNQAQHQYKVKSFAEEIRGLESEEPPVELSPLPETNQDEEKPSEQTQQEDKHRPTGSDSQQKADKPLIDMLQDELFIESSLSPPDLMGGEESLVPPLEQQADKEEKKEEEKAEHEEASGGLDQTGPGDETHELTAESEMARLMDLLNIDDQPAASTEAVDASTSLSSSVSQTVSASDDKWEQFSAFMDTSAGSSEPDYTGWEKELLQDTSQAANSSLSTELEDLFTADSQLEALANPTAEPATSRDSSEVTFDPLLDTSKSEESSVGLHNPNVFEPTGASGLEQLGLDSSLFSQPQQNPLMPTGGALSLAPASGDPMLASGSLPLVVPGSGVMPSIPTAGGPLPAGALPSIPTAGGPLPAGVLPSVPTSVPPSSLLSSLPMLSGPPLPTGTAGQDTTKPLSWNPPQSSSLPQLQQPSPKGTREDKKKPSWMNVFAHLDPIANEKA